jgi:hypothetical protein
MSDFKEIVSNSYSGYFNYLKNEVFSLHIENYFYGLIFISLAIFILEIVFPWRKNQPVFRKDFGWMYFICSLISFF